MYSITGSIIFLIIAFNVFFPKILLIGSHFYLYEPFLALLSILFLANYRTNNVYIHNIVVIYFIYLFVLLVSSIISFLFSGVIEFRSFFKIIRYFYIFFIFFIAFQIGSFINEIRLKKILFYNFIFVFLWLIYLLYHYYNNPLPDIVYYTWTYAKEYRFIGLTGKAFDLRNFQIVNVGNTSVQMGVFTALFSSIFLSLYFNSKKNLFYLFCLFLFVIATIMTFSRSGFLILLIIFLTFFNQFKNKRVFKIYLIIFSLILLFFLNDSFFNFINSFGVLGKIFITADLQDESSSTRLDYWLRAFNLLKENPFLLISGVGFGDYSSYKFIKTPHLESLFFTTLFQSGILGFLFLTFFFLTIYKSMIIYLNNNESKSIYYNILYGLYKFYPGFILANLLGGDSLHSDFISPVFFGLLGICFKNLKYNNNL